MGILKQKATLARREVCWPALRVVWMFAPMGGDFASRPSEETLGKRLRYTTTDFVEQVRDPKGRRDRLAKAGEDLLKAARGHEAAAA